MRLPACWCGLVALKPSLGRVPIDPPYVGRVAGPMTRTVDDAALMMSVLSRPDRRDGMSLPRDDINWKALDKSPRKLRIGLMLDLGVGQALEKEVREVAVKAAKAFESAGAVVTEVDGILTREMLDGLDNFWRARMWDDLSKLAAGERAKALPYIYKWAEAGAKLSGVDVIRGFNATMAIRAAAAKLFCDLDYVISPVSPVVNFPAEFAAPLNDPAQAVRAHLLHRAVEHVGKSGHLDQWRLRQEGLSDRRADRRPPLRRSRRARHGQGVRGPARPAEAVAEPAEEVSRTASDRHAPGLTRRIHRSSVKDGLPGQARQ